MVRSLIEFYRPVIGTINVVFKFKRIQIIYVTLVDFNLAALNDDLQP